MVSGIGTEAAPQSHRFAGTGLVGAPAVRASGAGAGLAVAAFAPFAPRGGGDRDEDDEHRDRVEDVDQPVAGVREREHRSSMSSAG